MLSPLAKWKALRGELLEAKFDIEQECPYAEGRLLDVIDIILETMHALDVEE